MDPYVLVFLVALLPMPALAALAWIATLGMRSAVNRHLETERRIPMLGASANTRWDVEVSYVELHPRGGWGRFHFVCNIAFLIWPLVSVVILIAGYVALRSAGV